MRWNKWDDWMAYAIPMLFLILLVGGCIFEDRTWKDDRIAKWNKWDNADKQWCLKKVKYTEHYDVDLFDCVQKRKEYK